MYVRYQSVSRDEKGAIVAGSASIYRTVYDPATGNKGHSRQEVVEPLGVEGYCVDDDAFYEAAADEPRLAGTVLENVD